MRWSSSSHRTTFCHQRMVFVIHGMKFAHSTTAAGRNKITVTVRDGMVAVQVQLRLTGIKGYPTIARNTPSSCRTSTFVTNPVSSPPLRPSTGLVSTDPPQPPTCALTSFRCELSTPHMHMCRSSHAFAAICRDELVASPSSPGDSNALSAGVFANSSLTGSISSANQSSSSSSTSSPTISAAALPLLLRMVSSASDLSRESTASAAPLVLWQKLRQHAVAFLGHLSGW